MDIVKRNKNLANLVEMGHVVSEICSRADRETDAVITIIWLRVRGGVITTPRSIFGDPLTLV